MTTYTVEITEPIGIAATTCWRILADGARDGYVYDTREEAEQMLARKVELDRLNAAIEAAIGQERHYGIRVWSESDPRRSTPTWRMTDPYRGCEGYAFAWYSTDPPPVDVYAREQYERACAAAELEPAADADLGTYADQYFQIDLHGNAPAMVVTVQLRRRRLAGINRERATQKPDAPTQAAPEVELDGRPCDECGGQILAGQAMVASLGLACGPDCYDAMADRPGRHARSVRR